MNDLERAAVFGAARTVGWLRE